MEYQEAWQFLDDLQFHKIKLGLDSMKGFLKSLDNPQNGLDFIHIAGTNGKGSTAVTLLSMLSKAGYKVGLYTSPHLSSVRERFRINDNYISENDFARNAEKIITVMNGRQITYFEFATTMALLWFKEQDVDFAILEVGMGGRLDATNVIEPLVSIITNVSMDHEAYLGDTLQKVAYEKAGVIKKGVPVVSAAAPDVSRSVILDRAKDVGASVYLLTEDFSYSGQENCNWNYSGIGADVQYDALELGLDGEHQVSNASLALAAVELLGDAGYTVPIDAIREGLKRVRWPGRMEYITIEEDLEGQPDGKGGSSAGENATGTTRYLLDGAHNPAGVKTLKERLESEGRNRSIVAIWASMADKDIQNSILPMIPLFDHIILTRPESERSATPEEIKKILPPEKGANVHSTNSVEDAIEKARGLVEPGGLVCIAGSLYLIGAARKILLGELVP